MEQPLYGYEQDAEEGRVDEKNFETIIIGLQY
jgi:hypothetical protein